MGLHQVCDEFVLVFAARNLLLIFQLVLLFSIAGAIVGVLVAPMELVRCRLQAGVRRSVEARHTPGGPGHYDNPRQVIADAWQHGGVKGLFKVLIYLL